MVLHSGWSLQMAPDLSPAELESLTRSVEQKKQRLEHDISNYIKRKQDELRNYEQEVPYTCALPSLSPCS
jgi:transcription termination factor NusB